MTISKPSTAASFTDKRGITTRAAPATHEEWVPHAYQVRAVAHLRSRWCAALWLDPGLGKTSIVLEAFRGMKEEGLAKKMLVIAPLRVCQLVWRQEGQQWTQFRDLTFSLVHGRHKAARLQEDTDIHIINPEAVPWLVKNLKGAWPYDTVVIDELTKFKNHSAKRHKALRPLIAKAARRWGLTGTPIPNGYMDLFGQIMLLDEGHALGKYITHFRDRYFTRGFNGFDWQLRKGADKRIEERVKPYVLRMAAEDYIELPQLVHDIRKLELPPAERKLYNQLNKEMLIELEGSTLTAASSGAKYSKLKQLANGAVYMGEGERRRFVKVHDLKLDALEELVESLAGQPLLIGYEFKHDLERIRERLGDFPDLGECKTDKAADALQRKWNAGEIPLMSAHPASAAHGLNLQKGAACHLCWFSVTIDLELYDQFLRRLLRQGNKSSRVISHALLVTDTADEDSLATLGGKSVTQDTMLARVKGDTIEEDISDMIRKLGKGNAAAEGAPTKVKGWGSKATSDAEEAPTEPTQREAVEAQLSKPAEAPDMGAAPNSAFSAEVLAKANGGEPEQPAAEQPAAEAPEPKKRAPRKTAATKQLEEDVAAIKEMITAMQGDGSSAEAPPAPDSYRRETAFQLAISAFNGVNAEHYIGYEVDIITYASMVDKFLTEGAVDFGDTE